MKSLELLAPARNADIGIAAINCGADAVYIAAGEFGARKAAGNSIEEIARLCRYAHKFGARVFMTVNTVLADDELERAHSIMLEAQDAGVDAFIIRDPVICGWKDIKVPLHASTQCAIRDARKAGYFEALGCARIILERELSLEKVREICAAVHCEVEFFVHGALCVCYSGECRLSEYIGGRSADKGDCMQACRSLYDLTDESGKVLVHNKALLSLKDYNLKNRIEELADAGISSFKIEGRLKNASYVMNVVRDYDIALNNLIAAHPEKYSRASFGRISGGFTPDTRKTFNRGYTELFLDGRRGRWSSMDAPKSMGEAVGKIRSVRPSGKCSIEISIAPLDRNLSLKNGDGFSFASEDGITGFRGNICSGTSIFCKSVPDIRPGIMLFRNINSAFEKELETNQPVREIPVRVDVSVRDGFIVEANAASQDGRNVAVSHSLAADLANNRERTLQMIASQLSKRSGHYIFEMEKTEVLTSESSLPLMSASFLNGIRRELSDKLDNEPCRSKPLPTGQKCGGKIQLPPNQDSNELMRSRYCIRYELGMCPRLQGAPDSGRLFLVNNGRRFALGFDCTRCEMTVTPDQK